MDTRTPSDPASERASVQGPADTGTRTAPARPQPASAKRGLVILLILLLVVVIVGAISDDEEEQPAPVASPSATQTASPGPGGQGPAAPTLTAVEPGPSQVEVSWQPPPAGDSTIAGYLVSHNGELIATLGEDQLSFVDRKVDADAAYSYTVAAFDTDGFGSAPSASITVRTQEANPASARIDGTFEVALRETSRFGYTTFGTPPTPQRWDFSSTCDEGPCAVNTTVDGIDGASFRLTPGVNGYRGSYRTDTFVRCDGVPITTEVAIRLSVEDAAVVGSVWTATRLAGEITHREAPQLACDATGADFAAVGVRAR